MKPGTSFPLKLRLSKPELSFIDILVANISSSWRRVTRQDAIRDTLNRLREEMRKRGEKVEPDPAPKDHPELPLQPRSSARVTKPRGSAQPHLERKGATRPQGRRRQKTAAH